MRPEQPARPVRPREPVRERRAAAAERFAVLLVPMRRRLDRWDARFAHRWLRGWPDAPRAALAGAVFLAFAGVVGVTQQSGAAAQSSAVAAGASAFAPNRSAVKALQRCGIGTEDTGESAVGPKRGTAVGPYIRARTAVLRTCSTSVAAVPALAIVSFARSATPELAAAALGDAVTVDAVYAAFPGKAATPYVLALRPPAAPGPDRPAALRATFAQAASAFASDAGARTGTAATLPVTEQAAAARLQARAATDRGLQTAAEAGCACIYGAAVEADVATLRTLSDSAQVRLVDVAPYGTQFAGVSARPLLPSELGGVGDEATPAVFQVGAP